MRYLSKIALGGSLAVAAAAVSLAPALSQTAPAAAAAPADDGAGEALFNSKCSGCHGTDVPLGQRHTAAEWKDIIARMEDNGLSASQQEKDAIQAFLSKPGSPTAL